MTLETVLWILILAPIVIGAVIGAISVTGSKNRITPVFIVKQPSTVEQFPFQSVAPEDDGEFLKAHTYEHDRTHPSKLEESQDAMEVLSEIPGDGHVKVAATNYEVSELPEDLNRSLEDLFNALDTGAAESAKRSVATVLDLPEENAPQVSYEDFERSLETIDEMLDYLQRDENKVIKLPFGMPISPREYLALQRKYGDEIVSKVTTTPGAGPTGEYDCMIGRVFRMDEQTVIQYGNHFIPLKGMENKEGVFLVEGMFIRPDLFYVRDFTDLEKSSFINKVAENG